MVKDYSTYINENINNWFTADELADIEKYNARREEARLKIQVIDTYHYFIFYMVKYINNDTECWAYNISNVFLYNKYISPELGYKSEDDFKKFIYSCFRKEKPNILKYYQENFGKDVDIISSEKWILKPYQSDPFNDWSSLKPWMKNAFDNRQINKRYDNRYPNDIDNGYKKYEENFFKIQKQFKEDFDKISDEYRTNPLLVKYNGYILTDNTVKGLKQRAARSYRRY